MKTIGLLGGMSAESTIVYYKTLNEETRKILGGLHSAKICMQSLDFAPLNLLMKQNNWEKIAEILLEKAKLVEQAGADFLLIATNTMHKLVPFLEKQLSMPIIHIADACAEILLTDKIKKIGLLGTKFTMQEDFYKQRLREKFGIHSLVPDSEIQTEQNKIIFEELCLGKICEQSKADYLKVITDFANQGAEAVILGCTEIGLLIKQKDTPIKILDSAEAHCKIAVRIANENSV
jgi:aspartate racemase